MKTRASEFDRAFDEGEDVTDKLEVEKARRVNYETRRVNVDFPDCVNGTRKLIHLCRKRNSKNDPPVSVKYSLLHP
ncbi:MAG TPA: hypothetical protein ENK38_01415, partial [Gammaproteobacteria bacterium]|nr:hypothetical protein [Gammaproteobacteria bacterium]